MYPKTFFESTELKTQPSTCFIVIPFASEFDPVFAVIKQVLEDEMGLSCTRTDELRGGGNIIEDILHHLGTSELVVADVTGRNPNVFYELGIAHMCKPVDKVLLLSQEIDSIPFDLRTFRHIGYTATPRGLEKLAASLREAVGAVSEKVHRIVVDKKHRGALPERLMGRDNCLYGFDVIDAFTGHNSAKFRLKVTKHFITDRKRSSVVFDQGLGLMLGKERAVPRTEWAVVFEKTRAGAPCFRIKSAVKRAGADGPRLAKVVAKGAPAKKRRAAAPRNKLSTVAKKWIAAAESARAAKTLSSGGRAPRGLVAARDQFERAWSDATPATRKGLPGDVAFNALSHVNRLYRLGEADSSLQPNANFWADEAIRHFSEIQDRQYLTEALLDKAAIFLDIAQLGHNDRQQFETMARDGDAIMTRAYQTSNDEQRATVLRISSRFYYALARPKSFRLSEDWDNNYLLLAYEKVKTAQQLDPADIKNANQLARTTIKASKNPPQDSDTKWTKRLRDAQRKLKEAWTAAEGRLVDVDGRLSPLNVLGVVTLETIAREWSELAAGSRARKATAYAAELESDALSPLREAVALLQNSQLRKAYSFDLYYDIARVQALKTAITRVAAPQRAAEEFAELKVNLLAARENAKTSQLEAAMRDVGREIAFSLLAAKERTVLTGLLAIA